MTHDDLKAWLEAYVEAWRTYDPAAIAALFTEEATYTYHPWDRGEELVQGRDAIVANWLRSGIRPVRGRPRTGRCSSREIGRSLKAPPNTPTAATTGTFGFSVSGKTTAAQSSWSGIWSRRRSELPIGGEVRGTK